MIPGQCCPSLMCNIPNVGTYYPVTQLTPNPKPTPGPNGVYPTVAIDPNPQLVVVGGRLTGIGDSGLPGGGTLVSQNFGAITGIYIF